MTILPSSAKIYIYIHISSKSLPHRCLVQKFHRENGGFQPSGPGEKPRKKTSTAWGASVLGGWFLGAPSSGGGGETAG